KIRRDRGAADRFLRSRSHSSCAPSFPAALALRRSSPWALPTRSTTSVLRARFFLEADEAAKVQNAQRARSPSPMHSAHLSRLPPLLSQPEPGFHSCESAASPLLSLRWRAARAAIPVASWKTLPSTVARTRRSRLSAPASILRSPDKRCRPGALLRL